MKITEEQLNEWEVECNKLAGREACGGFEDNCARFRHGPYCKSNEN